MNPDQEHSLVRQETAMIKSESETPNKSETSLRPAFSGGETLFSGSEALFIKTGDAEGQFVLNRPLYNKFNADARPREADYQNQEARPENSAPIVEIIPPEKTRTNPFDRFSEAHAIQNLQKYESALQEYAIVTQNNTESINQTLQVLQTVRSEIGIVQLAEETLQKNVTERIKFLEKNKASIIEALMNLILAMKLEQIFDRMRTLQLRELHYVLEKGTLSEGQLLLVDEGQILEPEQAKLFAKAFDQGIETMPQILEKQPELLETAGQKLLKEAQSESESLFIKTGEGQDQLIMNGPLYNKLNAAVGAKEASGVREMPRSQEIKGQLAA